MWNAVAPDDVKGPAPSARSKHSATLVGEYIYLLGGRNGNLPTKDFWKYSLDGRDAGVLCALHGFFIPNEVIEKDIHGTSQTTKFTIRDSQLSFLYIGKTVQEAVDRINFLQSKKSSIQLFIFAIEKCTTKIEEIHTYFDGIEYEFFNMIRQ